MSDLAEPPPRVGVKRALLRWSTQFGRIRSPLLRYGSTEYKRDSRD